MAATEFQSAVLQANALGRIEACETLISMQHADLMLMLGVE